MAELVVVFSRAIAGAAPVHGEAAGKRGQRGQHVDAERQPDAVLEGEHCHPKAKGLVALVVPGEREDNYHRDRSGD